METGNFSSIIDKSNIQNLAIGRFDGMHIAHQKLFSKLNKTNSAILVIDAGYSNLTPHKYKQEFVEIPIIFFELAKIRDIDGLDFIDRLCDMFPNLQKIVVGYDFRFGKDRKYDIFDLSSKFDGIVEVIDEIKVGSDGVHSKAIREYISKGNFEMTNKMLGREYSIRGNHIKGQGLGKEQFVPTININVDDFLVPNDGIYATKTMIDDRIYKSVTFIGHRVSTDNSFAIETHLLDANIQSIDRDIIHISFVTKIRDNKKFDNFSELKQQIMLDIDTARNILV